MKKLFLLVTSLCLLSIIFIPVLASADGLVPCTGANCTICSFFQMLANIYDFIVKMIATPLAVIALSVGGIMMMVSSGNPNLASNGKKVIYAAIIGLLLVWCSWLIIDFVLQTIGYGSGGSWATLGGSCK